MAYTSLAGKKLQQKLGASLNESASAPTSSFAKKQLEKMGWKEGDGLGARSTGIKTHIRVYKREDDVGVGHDKLKLAEASNMWWSSSISNTLEKLSSKRKKKKNKKDKKKTKKIYTDEELFEATGGARFGMRAQRRAESKWARTEKNADLSIQEEKAKGKLEWNGLGEAKLLLEDNHKNKSKDAKDRKRKRENNDNEVVEEKKCDEVQSSTISKKDKKEKKKKKKKEEKRKKKER